MSSPCMIEGRQFAALAGDRSRVERGDLVVACEHPCGYLLSLEANKHLVAAVYDMNIR